MKIKLTVVVGIDFYLSPCIPILHRACNIARNLPVIRLEGSHCGNRLVDDIRPCLISHLSVRNNRKNIDILQIEKKRTIEDKEGTVEFFFKKKAPPSRHSLSAIRRSGAASRHRAADNPRPPSHARSPCCQSPRSSCRRTGLRVSRRRKRNKRNWS
jgi:hypothetical protein